jgi:uncharacterized UBP type Zn finger protein
MNTQSKNELNDLGLKDTYALRAVTFHIGESITNGHYIGIYIINNYSKIYLISNF